jgi:predicted nucleic acid-binding protein
VTVLFDTNVVLDVLLQRNPWQAQAQALWDAHDQGWCTACVTASTLSDIYYLARRHAGQVRARDAVRECLDRFVVLAVDVRIADEALKLPVPDFEDALQIAAAVRHCVDMIATRDVRGYVASPIEALDPADVVARLS